MILYNSATPHKMPSIWDILEINVISFGPPQGRYVHTTTQTYKNTHRESNEIRTLVAILRGA
jgi:hypothetical protein